MRGWDALRTNDEDDCHCKIECVMSQCEPKKDSDAKRRLSPAATHTRRPERSPAAAARAAVGAEASP